MTRGHLHEQCNLNNMAVYYYYELKVIVLINIDRRRQSPLPLPKIFMCLT